MDEYYGYSDARSGQTHRRAPPATNTQAHHEPSAGMRYTGACVSLNTYPPVPTPSIQCSAYQHSRESYHASPYHPLSHPTEAGNEYLPQHQTELRSSTGSEPTSWRADTQNFAAATSSMSTSSDHWNLRHSRMMDSSQEQPYSPLPFTIDRLELLQHRSNEAGPRLSFMPDDQSNSFWGLQDHCVDPALLQLSNRFQGQDEAEPWSSLHPRYTVPGRGYTDQGQQAMTWGSGDLGSVPSTLLSGIHGASVPSERQDISEKTFNSDIANIIKTISNSQILETNMQPLQQAPYGINHPGNNVSPDRVAFQYRLDRAETPHNTEADVAYGQEDNLLVYLSPGFRSPDRNTSSPSTDSSHISITSSSEPAILHCSDPGCGRTFHGNHRRGSLNRHVRRKHRGLPGDHPCKEPYCDKTFNRSDSRLKHYRKHHPWRANGPPIPRPPQGTQLTGSSQRSAGRRGG